MERNSPHVLPLFGPLISTRRVDETHSGLRCPLAIQKLFPRCPGKSPYCSVFLEGRGQIRRVIRNDLAFVNSKRPLFCKSKKDSDHPMELKPKNYRDAVRTSEVQKTKKKECKTFVDRMKENLRYFLKEEVLLQVEQCRQGKGEKQSNSSLSDWATKMHDKAPRMVSFLWEKKSAIGIGMLLAFARLGSVEGHSLRGCTTLRLLESNNATSLSCLGWEEFHNPSNPMARQQFHPGKGTPEGVEHFKKVRVQDPELFIRNVEQRRYDEASSEQGKYSKKKGRDPLSSNGEKIDPSRSLMGKLKENPEARRRFEKMFNEKKMRERSLLEKSGRMLLSDQKSACLAGSLFRYLSVRRLHKNVHGKLFKRSVSMLGGLSLRCARHD